jgi:hypothetical protein
MALTPNVIVYLRDSDRGTNDYKAGDIVDIQDGVRASPTELGVQVYRFPFLPPESPFWLVRVWGVTKAECSFLMESTTANKRTWQLQQKDVPTAVKNYLLAHRFCGFGSADDIANYGATVSGDTVLQWSTVRTWFLNKDTKQTA